MTPTAVSTSAPPKRKRTPPRQMDRAFFGGMVILLTIAVIIGFGRTYFFVGMPFAPLPSRLIHIHGAVFTLWFVLLNVQTFLIPAGKVQWHMSLGLAAYCVAALMVPLGYLAAGDGFRRGLRINGLDPVASFGIPIFDITNFGILVLLSYLLRRKPLSHKRLVLYSSIALMGAAVSRWPISTGTVGIIMLSMLLLPVLYDLIALHRIHRYTILAVAISVVLHAVQPAVIKTHGWSAFAHSMGRF